MPQHEKTLQAIFEKPTRADIPWRDVEALFRRLGAAVVEGKGSRVRVNLNGVRSVFHRPHPQKEAPKAAVKGSAGFSKTQELTAMLEYKGYQGAIDDVEPEGGWFHGAVVGIQDVVTFQGRTVPELEKEFRESVDVYLEFCEDLKEAPEKPFSGKFVVRMSPELHKLVWEAARQEDVSLNSWLVAAIKQRLHQPATEGPPLSFDQMENLAQSVAVLLARKKRRPPQSPRAGKPKSKVRA